MIINTIFQVFTKLEQFAKNNRYCICDAPKPCVFSRPHGPPAARCPALASVLSLAGLRAGLRLWGSGRRAGGRGEAGCSQQRGPRGREAGQEPGLGHTGDSACWPARGLALRPSS